ncbi:dTDP-4-dehydrorhamnose 3,5-epimerase [Rhizomicrobium electricum]|uniref:dTDP-4-dehydrorhamnose 3,5-epimerase n=1 Tax=Rhizomicrobium electricum TaxID=480070 RepID=A0ABN1E8K5_9PROT|nr:dTDP-4-dehydrorhamnose 3,5-epimerase [Rhizomicrobium electricum]
MKVLETTLPGAKIIEPTVFGDDRGFFFESWNAREFTNAGLEAEFVQDNHSRSARGVLRGLHYQIECTQAKLIRVVSGAVFDVAVDLRSSSPHFGHWIGVELSEENKRQLWIPAGFAHGFLCLKDGTEFLYKCTDYYAPEHERTVLWDDPSLNIAWPLDGITPKLSLKDRLGKPLGEAEIFR